MADSHGRASGLSSYVGFQCSRKEKNTKLVQIEAVHPWIEGAEKFFISSPGFNRAEQLPI
jgi:hypothetical protein